MRAVTGRGDRSVGQCRLGAVACPGVGVVLVVAVVLLGAGRALTRLGGGAVSVAVPSVIRGLF